MTIAATTARAKLLVIDLPAMAVARVSRPLQDCELPVVRQARKSVTCPGRRVIPRSCSVSYRKGPGKAASARCSHSFSWRWKKITPVVIQPTAATSNSKLTGLVTRLISSPNR